jgi:hypothetical protein
MTAKAALRLVLAAALLTMGCGTAAQATDACRKIEQARCQRARALCPELGIHDEASLDECLGAARDLCLHGLPVGDPGTALVDRCVAAVSQAQTCDVVLSPEKAPECAFLSPEATADAGATVDAASGTDP